MVGEHTICFYTDHRQISGQYPIWVQAVLTTVVRMFERVILQKNMNKTKAVMYMLGFIWGKHGSESYK